MVKEMPIYGHIHNIFSKTIICNKNKITRENCKNNKISSMRKHQPMFFSKSASPTTKKFAIMAYGGSREKSYIPTQHKSKCTLNLNCYEK